MYLISRSDLSRETGAEPASAIHIQTNLYNMYMRTSKITEKHHSLSSLIYIFPCTIHYSITRSTSKYMARTTLT